MTLRPLAAAVLLCLAPPLLAQTERELDAHEHGAATLDVTLDGARLYLDLRTPADNLLGFEHAPSTPAQHDAVDAARATLDSARPYVPTDAAGCVAEAIDVNIALAHDGDEHDGEHDDEDEHVNEHGGEHSDEDEHAEAHDDEHGDEHGDGHVEADVQERAGGHDGDRGETHSDITTSHVFLCESPERLDEVATTLFDAFEGFEDIDVRLVGPGGQAAVELRPGQAVIALESVR